MANDKSREVRIGLVMYGGVSLAVYINGVSNEFFRAVHGSGVYKLIKSLTDSEIVVDIISGTSAGGINGIFLSYALTNGLDFSSVAKLWRDLGDINALLRSPRTEPEQCKSLLDSEVYYQNTLRDALQNMTKYQETYDDPTDIKELDLFVTGTNIDGNIYTIFDDAGHPIDVKDHRNIFLLKHRAGRKTPFDPTSSEYPNPEVAYSAFSKLARITSCFPAAFAPVRVTNPSDQRSEDFYLRNWGNLEKEAYFLDGGLLDNKPFSHTIREIFHRSADCEVERILCYVEPDPERFLDVPLAEPSFFRATQEGAYGITSYESIADDLKLIAEHNSRVDLFNRLSKDLRGLIPRSATKLGVLPPSSLTEPHRTLYLNSRLAQISSRAIRGVLKVEGKDQYLTGEIRRNAADLIKIFDAWKGTGTDTLENFDIYFRLRRLFHVIYRISEKCSKELELRDVRPADERVIPLRRSETVINLWRALNLQVKFLEIVQFWMEMLIDSIPIEWRNRQPEEVWNELSWALGQLLNIPGWHAPHNLPSMHSIDSTPESYARNTPPHEGLTKKELDRVYDALRIRVESIKDEFGKANTRRDVITNFAGLLQAADSYEAQIFDHYSDPKNEEFRSEYDEFVNLDAVLFPMELLSDLYEKDIIKTVRISPVDAQQGFSMLPLERKVAGKSLAHFGGFFKKSWRANDILWGRLDGICQLVECTLTFERLETVMRDNYLRHRIRNRIFLEDGTQQPTMNLRRLFPKCGDETLETFVRWLRRLVDDNEQVRNTALAENEFKKHRNLLIEIGQLEILHQEVPAVIKDAIEEQHNWNRFRVDSKPQKVLTDKKIKTLINSFKYEDPQSPEASDLQLCIALAGWTGHNEARIEEHFRKSGRWNETKWNSVTESENLPYGKVLIQRAIAQNRMIYDIQKARFRPGNAMTDSLVTTVAAEQYARIGLSQFHEATATAPVPALTKIGTFFKYNYGVGSEEILKHIPGLVLLEVITKGLLVFRNCILGALPPETRDRVQSHLIYKYGIHLPLNVAHRLVRMWRQEPVSRVIVETIVTTASVIALVISVGWWDHILFRESLSKPNFKWLVLFFVLPACILLLQIKRLLHRSD